MDGQYDTQYSIISITFLSGLYLMPYMYLSCSNMTNFDTPELLSQFSIKRLLWCPLYEDFTVIKTYLTGFHI